MPVNKKAQIRYFTLDRCFRNTGRGYSIEDLLEECNKALAYFDPKFKPISKRQLYEDIKFMESATGYNIELNRTKEGKKTYYRYSDPSFSINNAPLRPNEVEKLKAAIDVLTHFTGLPQFEWLYEIIPILDNKFHISSKMQPVIEIDSNKDFKGLHHIEKIYHSIVNRVVLKISYQSFYEETLSTFFFHPYYLKEYNNRWFVYGLNESKNIDTWNLSLDRIISIEETNKPYKTFEFNWESFFYDIIGATRYQNESPMEIVLLFYPESAHYVYNKPLHPSQRAKWIGQNLQVKINVIPNRELENIILSYGKNVEVISPEILRERVKEILSEALSRYLK